jgi:hypothetical protein
MKTRDEENDTKIYQGATTKSRENAIPLSTIARKILRLFCDQLEISFLAGQTIAYWACSNMKIILIIVF